MNSKRGFNYRFFVPGIFALFTFATAGLTLGADALEEVRAISKLPGIDLRLLERGDVIGIRGPIGTFPRGVYVESGYVIHAPAGSVREKLMHWNSASHPELDIKVLREYRWPAAPTTWDSLVLDPVQREDRWLIGRTSQLLLNGAASTDLHVTRAEVASFRTTANKAGAVNAFWRQLLRERNDSLASKGFAGLTPYSVGSTRIEAKAELANFWNLAPAIASHFRGLINGPPFVSGSDATGVEIAPYWEAAVIRGHTNLHAGFLVSRKEGASWQLADCTYYSSDTYFMSISLYELIPQDNGTFVWQVDFVSAPFRSYIGGLDRVIAADEMLRETAETAKLLRADIEKNQ